MPEKLIPGKVNIFGSSHQIFHVAVLVASWIHWQGLLRMAERVIEA
jgi:adiponectin receptor